MTISRGSTGLTAEVYVHTKLALRDCGHGGDYEWSESLQPPETPEALACEYTWVVLNSGMKNTVARKIMDRVWPRLVAGEPIAPVFGHEGKAAAIELVWQERARHFVEFAAAPDIVAWCETLPWIGKITKYHLAKNLGADVAKPDRWLERLAAADGETVDGLCARLALETGDRIATVDVVLWRACAVGVLRVEQVGGVWRITQTPERVAS